MAMTNVMSMIFEVMDLAQASPATVSRCGMIYMESANLGWRPFVESWTETTNDKWCSPNAEFLLKFFDWLLDPCLEFIRKFCKQHVYSGEISLVMTTLRIIEMTIDKAASKYIDENYHIISWLQGTIMFAIFWGVGGILDKDSRYEL